MQATENLVSLTDGAIAKVKEFFAQDESLKGKSLRVFVEQGGCSGNNYGFRFDDAAAEGDVTQSFEGFNLLIDTKSGELLKGAIIDYKEEFGQEGFSIKNPNAKKSCGCGNSFEA